MATDIARLLGNRLAQTAAPKPATRGASIADAMRQRTQTYAPAPAPTPAPPAPSLGSFGALTAQDAAPAIASAFDAIIPYLQGAEGEPWVEVWREDDPDGDPLYMPRSVAETAPDGYTIGGELSADQQAYQEQGPFSIYVAPEEIQAAFGLTPSGERYELPGVSTGPVGDPRAQGQSLSALAQQAQGQQTGDSIWDTVGEAQDQWGRLFDIARPGIQDAVGDASAGWGRIFESVPPIVAHEAGQAVSEGAGGAGDFLGAILGPESMTQGTIGDIAGSSPGDWLLTEGVPLLQQMQDLARVETGGDGLSERAASGVTDTFQDLVGTIMTGSEAALPETLEDIPEAFLNLVSLPFEFGIEQRVEAIRKAQNGEDLNPAEIIYVNLAMSRAEVSDAIEDIPVLGAIREKTENVGPLDFEEWMVENPAAVAEAYDAGGAQGVWDRYQTDTTGEGLGGMLLRLGRDVTNDPLTYLPIGAAAGSATSRAGTALRLAPEASAARVGTGRLLENLGEGVRLASRGAEQVADLGAEHLLNAIARTVNATGLTSPHATSRQAIEQDEINQSLDQAAATQTRINQGVGPDAGAPVDAGDVARAGVEDEPQPVDPDIGPDAGGPPRVDAPESDLAADAGDAARLTEEQAEARVETAQSQPEPPVEAEGGTDNVPYTDSVVIRRTDDGQWQVEVSTDGGRTIERLEPSSWEDALSDAEITRRNIGENAERINLIPARWVPDTIHGKRVIDSVIRDMEIPQRNRLMDDMGDAWHESVERQAAIKEGGDPVVDHAIETSRITADTLDRAQQINPNVGRPPYRANAGQGRGLPYHAADDVINLPWSATAAQRHYLYGGRSSNLQWKPAGTSRRPPRIKDGEMIADRLGDNPSRAKIEQARRYADLVAQHERWHPNDTSRGFAEAKAKAEAIRNHPAFDRDLISEGGLPGSRRTAGQRREEARGREAEDAAARDREVDPRYAVESIEEGDGPRRTGTAITYRIDDQHQVVITTIARRDLTDADIARYADHPDVDSPVWYDGVLVRDGQNVGTALGPNQAEVIDSLTERIETTDTPPVADDIADDAARAADPEQETTTQTDETPEPAQADPDEPAPAGTASVRDEVVEPPQSPPKTKPLAEVPPQVKHVGRVLGTDTPRRSRPRRRVQRSTDFIGTTNEGVLFGDTPLAPEVEDVLTKFTFADGTTLLKRVDELYWQYMEGKSRLYPEQARDAAIQKAKEDVAKRLTELYPAKEIPAPLKKFVKVWDGWIQYQRERILFGWPRAVAYPMIQATGNVTMAMMNGKSPWFVSRYMTKGWREAQRRSLAPADLADNAKLADFHQKVQKDRAKLDRQGKKGKLAEQAEASHMAERLTLYRRMADGDDAKPWMSDPAIPAYSKLLANLNLGEGREIRDLTQGVYADISGDATAAELKLRQISKNVFGTEAPGKIGRLLGSRRIARWGAYWDGALRQTVGLFTMRDKLRQLTPDFRNYVKSRMQRWTDLPDAEIDRLWDEFWDKSKDGTFSADDLYKHYRQHLTDGQATRLHRDWQSRLNTMHKETRDEIKRVTYAGDETRADLVAKRVFVFHYFFSRQSWNFANQFARHPFLIHAYDEVQDELAQYAEEHEGIVPDYMKGWVALLGLPGGINLFAKPTHLISTYVLFRDAMDFEPDGMTDWGNVVKGVDDLVGLMPGIDTVVNLIGGYGDDFTPDPLQIWREAQIITTAINFARARGMGDSVRPIGNWYSDFNGWLRENVSGTLEGIIPGVEKVEAPSSVLAYEREINAIAIDEAKQMGRDPQFEDGVPANEDAVWVMAQLEDENSELYLRSVKRWTLGEGVTILGQALLTPLRPRTRLAAESGEGEGIGIAGAAIQPDLMQMVSEMGASSIMYTTPEAMELERQKAEYELLGTEEQRRADEAYTHIAYGFVTRPVTIDGVTYSPLEISRMSTDQREQMALAFLQDQGATDSWQDYKDEQDRWLAEEENREFATYTRWRKEVYDYEGGPMGYFEEAIAEGDQNARWFLESVLMNNFTYARTDAILASTDAYHAIQGVQADPFGPKLDAPGDDPLGIADGPERPIPYEPYEFAGHTELREDVPQVAQGMVEWDQAIAAKQAELGYDPSVPFSQLGYEDRLAIEDAVKADGTKEPYIPDSVKEFLLWQQQQPAGADTSLDAYIAAKDREYEAGAGERFRESIDPNKMTDAEAIAVLYPLWQEHDHEQYADSDSGSSGGSGSSSGSSNMGTFDWLFGG